MEVNISDHPKCHCICNVSHATPVQRTDLAASATVRAQHATEVAPYAVWFLRCHSLFRLKTHRHLLDQNVDQTLHYWFAEVFLIL
jgi:hypothetical protein